MTTIRAVRRRELRRVEARLRAQYTVELAAQYLKAAQARAQAAHVRRTVLYCWLFLLGLVIALAASITVVDSDPDAAGWVYVVFSGGCVAAATMLALYDKHRCSTSEARALGTVAEAYGLQKHR